MWERRNGSDHEKAVQILLKNRLDQEVAETISQIRTTGKGVFSFIRKMTVNYGNQSVRVFGEEDKEINSIYYELGARDEQKKIRAELWCLDYSVYALPEDRYGRMEIEGLDTHIKEIVQATVRGLPVVQIDNTDGMDLPLIRRNLKYFGDISLVYSSGIGQWRSKYRGRSEIFPQVAVACEQVWEMVRSRRDPKRGA